MPQGSSCCSQFEFCISCCLRPDQRASLQEILTAAAATNNVVFVSVSDHWELCLAKCRTSSESVQHENTYRYNDKGKIIQKKFIHINISGTRSVSFVSDPDLHQQ